MFLILNLSWLSRLLRASLKLMYVWLKCNSSPQLCNDKAKQYKLGFIYKVMSTTYRLIFFSLDLQPKGLNLQSDNMTSIKPLFVFLPKDDCLLKVWYNTSKWKLGVSGLFRPPDSNVSVQRELTFSFVYLAHPRSVTGLSWRKTSKYMPGYGHCQDKISHPLS